MSDDLDDLAADGHALTGLLADAGYAPYWFDGHGLIWRQTGHQTVDYFFLTQDQVARVRHAGVGVS